MKNIKSILIIAATDFPQGTSSANLLRIMGTGFQELGVKVQYILTRGNIYRNSEKHSKRVNCYREMTFTYSSFLNRPQNYFLKILEVLISIFTAPALVFLKKRRNKADAVIIYTGYAYQNLPIVLICKLLQIPVFKYSVDWYNKSAVVRKWWMLPKWWMFRLEIHFFDKLLNGIICISKLLYNHYVKIGISEKKLVLVPNILDLSFFENADPIVPHKKNNIILGYCGAAPLLNGVDDLIKAFSKVNQQHKNVELYIVGDVAVGCSQLPLLKQLAIEKGVSLKTTFFGRVPGKNVPSYLSSCDILVLARKNTQFAQAGFPTKLGEYMAAKKPVIMTKVGDIVEYFADKENIVMAEPDNPESLAQSINFLVENEHKRKFLAENGYIWAMKNLNYHVNCKTIYEFMVSNN